MNDGVADDDLDDAALARRVSSADAPSARAAEDALYRRLAPRVRLYGLKHLRDRHAAADLVQQVMMTTIERLRGGKLRDPERLVSFVLGMCRMVVLDLRRTYARRERLLETFGDQEAMAEPETTDRLDREKLLRALETLSERERSVLLMTFYDDRPAAEIAAELDLSEANVRVIRHRALERLRERVVGKGETR